MLSDDNLERVRALNEIAEQRGQTLAQMALAWTLRDERVTSTLVGASNVRQLEDDVASLRSLSFSLEELQAIDHYAVDSGINLWAESSAD
jgi:L-glyceraldehyde 3-phosphate reductase